MRASFLELGRGRTAIIKPLYAERFALRLPRPRRSHPYYTAQPQILQDDPEMCHLAAQLPRISVGKPGIY